MTCSEEYIRRRLRMGEDSQWEFKELAFTGNSLVSPSGDCLANEIVAFANAEGGSLLCGVNDLGDVQDLTREQLDSCLRAIEELSQNSIKPSIELGIFRIPVNDKLLLHVSVPQGYAMHEGPGGCLRRVGASACRMSSAEASHLAHMRVGLPSEFDRTLVPGENLASLDEAKWLPLLSAEDKLEPEAALERMGVLAADGQGNMHATAAGVLLFSLEPEVVFGNSVIMATWYSGTDRASRHVARSNIGGTLDEQIRQAYKFVGENMRSAARQQRGNADLLQYSEEAVYEALANAVAHRDYSIGGCLIRVSMFCDRLEVISPVNLPGTTTSEAIVERQAVINENVSSLLARMPLGDVPNLEGRKCLMKRAGQGVAVIRSETQRLCGMLPTYRLLGQRQLVLTIPAAYNLPIQD